MLSHTLPIALAFAPAVLAAVAPRQVAPGQSSHQILAPSQNGWCLQVSPYYLPTAGSGARVEPCASTSTIWTVGPGANPNIRFTGSNLCLDAGAGYNSSNGTSITVQTCDDSVPSQKWSYTSDKQLAVTGGTQCLDAQGPQLLATTKCGSTSTQVWELIEPKTTQPLYQIHPNGDENTCLVASSPAYGAPVKPAPCGTPFGSWYMNNGTNKDGISLTGPGGLCLNAAQANTNKALVTVDSCEYVDVFPRQQLWYYTADERIAIQGGNQCLDSGAKRTDGAVQTYACSSGNTNQVWTTSITNYPSDPVSFPPTPPPVGVQLHPNSNATECLAARGVFGVYAPLAVVACLEGYATGIAAQTFTFKRNQPTNVTLTYPTPYGQQTLCLDFGAGAASGATPKLYPCLNLPQQTLWVTNDNRVAVYKGDQCLDVVKGSKPNPSDETLADVQSWKCTTGNTQQIFTE